MKRAWLALGMMPLLAFACGESDPAENFVAACEDYCNALSGTDCGNSLVGQCGAGCDYFEQSLDGICVAEYSVTFDCLAKGEFECLQDIPVPTQQSILDCIDENQALIDCQLAAPCLRYCRDRVAGGCESSEEKCTSDCNAGRSQTDFCSFDEQQLFECLGENGAACRSGAVPEECSYDATQHADCVARDNVCAGYCLAVDYAGCGASGREACEANCNQTASGTCQNEYEQLMRCNAENGDVCVDGAAGNSSGCSFEQQNYESCSMGL